MKRKIINAVRIAVFLSIGVLLLTVAFRDISIEELISGLRSANYLWVLLSLTFASLAFISRTYRWVLLIEPLGYSPPVKNALYALMTGYLANFVLPRIGEITRCGSLNRTDRIPVGSLLGTVITERISDLFALLILGVYIFLAKIDFFGEFLVDIIISPIHLKISSWLSFSLFTWIMVAVSILLLVLLGRIIATLLRKRRLFLKLEKIAAGIFTGMKTVFQMKKMTQFLIHTLFIWLMYYLMTWSVFMALPATQGLGSNAVIFILVIGGLGMAAPVQGGIGAYHWIVSVGLGLYGIPREEGLVYATLSHESQALLMILAGSFSMLIVFLSGRKKVQPGALFNPLTDNKGSDG